MYNDRLVKDRIIFDNNNNNNESNRNTTSEDSTLDVGGKPASNVDGYVQGESAGITTNDRKESSERNGLETTSNQKRDEQGSSRGTVNNNTSTKLHAGESRTNGDNRATNGRNHSDTYETSIKNQCDHVANKGE